MFFVLVLIYVAIMALRLSRVERDLRELHARTQETAREDETRPRGDGAARRGAADEQTLGARPA